MENQKKYSLEDILLASERGESFDASISSKDQIMMITKTGVTLGVEDADKINKLSGYVESKYKVKLTPTGGGYGCTKIKYNVQGEEEAVELTKKMLADPEFRRLAKEADIDVIVNIDKKMTIGSAGEPHCSNISNMPEKGTRKRISSDGTVQNVAG